MVVLLCVLALPPVPGMACLTQVVGLVCLARLTRLTCLLGLFWLFRTVQNCLGWFGVILLKVVIPRPYNFEHRPTVL